MAADMITGSVADRALPKKIPGLWDRLDDYDVWRELCIRIVGEKKTLETGWTQKSIDEWYDWIIEPLGLGTLKEFCDRPLQAEGDHYIGRGYYVPPFKEKGYEDHGFGTPSGKVEVYSTVLEQLGYDPLPYWVEPAESPISTPEMAKEYPLILSTGGRHQEMHHGELFQISLARQLHPDPKMEIHPYTARDLNIGHGDWCWVETPIGRIKHRACWTTGILPGVIHIEHGWWFPEEPGQEPFLFGVDRCNASVIEDDDPDKANAETGMWTHKAMLCKVYRCGYPDSPTGG